MTDFISEWTILLWNAWSAFKLISGISEDVIVDLRRWRSERELMKECDNGGVEAVWQVGPLKTCPKIPDTGLMFAQ